MVSVVPSVKISGVLLLIRWKLRQRLREYGGGGTLQELPRGTFTGREMNQSTLHMLPRGAFTMREMNQGTLQELPRVRFMSSREGNLLGGK